MAANAALAFISPEAEAAYRDMTPGRSTAPMPADLKIRVLGIDLPVDVGVPESVCLPIPTGYMHPTKGKARAAHKRVALAVKKSRKVFVWGAPGTGKDAIFHALSYKMGIPAEIRTFNPNTDVNHWFFSREIGANGTSWSYSNLWRALTEGYTGADGITRPYMIVFSDIDRATPEQLEAFRLLLDTTSGRITGPTGDVFTILPGTRFVFTANSCGTGDATGRMSSQAMDASMLDRMGRFVEFDYMAWSDEEMILRSKFPTVVEADSDLLSQLGGAVTAVREAIKQGTLYAELTHRGICEVMMEVEDLLDEAGDKVPANLLRKGLNAWLSRLGDQRLAAKALCDAAIKGGVIARDDEDGEDDK